MLDKTTSQSQSSGDNSQMIQATTVNIYKGIDEKRAREIYAEEYEKVRTEFTKEACACAGERVREFEDSLITRIMRIEGAINAFSDPAFQLLLKHAQMTAAATERKADYALLSELLISHFEKKELRKCRTGIEYAVRIVDKIDDDALCALTIVYAMHTLFVRNATAEAGLARFDDLYKKLMYMELPSGSDWIEHLDILNAIRITTHLTHFKKFDQVFPEFLEGYSTAGICVDSEDYVKAMDLLSKVSIPPSLLIPNTLLSGYVQLPVSGKSGIESLIMSYGGNGKSITKKETEEQIHALEKVWDLYTKDSDIKQRAVSAFIASLSNYPYIKKLQAWWDKIPLAFEITHVGTALAHTNARRCEEEIPEL